MTTLAQIPGVPDSQGQGSQTGADITWGPIALYPPRRPNPYAARGRSVSIRNDGTAYTTIVLQGRLDPSDASGWQTVIDDHTNVAAVLAGGANKTIVLGADYAEIRVATTGGDGTSVIVGAVGP